MNKLNLTFLFVLFIVLGAVAQVPQKFNYQAVLRDGSGQPIVSEDVIVKIEILAGSPEGNAVFAEEHSTQTNAVGLINLIIGSVNSLGDIDWSDGNFYVSVSVDGQLMGTSQLLSVPFALQSLSSADSFSGDYDDLDNLPDLDQFIFLDEEAVKGDLLYFDNEKWQRLPIGEDGQVLTVVDGMLHWTDLPGGNGGHTVTDIDGNVYETVMINDQEWMASNLRTTRYQDGSLIEHGLDNEAWENTQEGAKAVYSHDAIDGIESEAEMLDAYGYLYNWYAAGDERGLCPAGWRVPNQSDYIALVEYMQDNYDELDVLNVGNALKSCRQIASPVGGECDTNVHPRWNEMATQYGIDMFGFAGLPAGIKFAGGSYASLGMQMHVWTADENPDDDTQAYSRFLNVFSGSVAGGFPVTKNAGYSVRCIKISN